MRFLTTILSIYFLGLSFMTCSDEVIVAVSLSDETSYISKIDMNSDSHKTDFCSPLCFCQCCQVNIDTVGFIYNKITPKEMFSHAFSYNDDAIQDVIYTILQPPQLVNSIL